MTDTPSISPPEQSMPEVVAEAQKQLQQIETILAELLAEIPAERQEAARVLIAEVVNAAGRYALAMWQHGMQGTAELDKIQTESQSSQNAITDRVVKAFQECRLENERLRLVLERQTRNQTH